jgi:hypothetical protein
MSTVSTPENNLSAMEQTKMIAQSAIKQGNIISFVLLILFVGFLVWITFEIIENRREPHVDSIQLLNPSYAGESVLCPGDVLFVKFDLVVEGEGPLTRDFSVQQGSEVVVFSEPVRFPVTGPINSPVTVPWVVPLTFFDFRTGTATEFPPGDYLYNVSVSTMVGEGTFDMESFPFSIGKESECNV